MDAWGRVRCRAGAARKKRLEELENAFFFSRSGSGIRGSSGVEVPKPYSWSNFLRRQFWTVESVLNVQPDCDVMQAWLYYQLDCMYGRV